MNKLANIIFLFCFVVQIAYSQSPTVRPHASNSKFDTKISRTIDFSVPVIGVEELIKIKENVILFDTREKEEYEVSHIEGALCLGYNDFNISQLSGISKDQKIVVYCSIGYRSEKIGERLREMGYHQVYNLYGSLFDWVNRGNPIVDQYDQPTKKVHTYNWLWSKWVDGKLVEKVW